MSENIVTPSRPSLPTVINALIVLILMAAFAALWRKIDQGAILLHLKAGQVISMTGELPNRDIFSASSSVGIWVYFEWVWAQTLHYLNEWGAWKLLNGATILLAALTLGLNWLRCRRAGASPSISLLTLTLGLITLVPVLQPAPGVAALPVFAAILLLTETKGKRWPLALYPALVSLWVNISVTAPIALLIPACRAIFPDLPSRQNPEPVRRNFFIFLVIAGMLSLAINPHSFSVYGAWQRNLATCIMDAGDRLTSLPAQQWFIAEFIFILLIIFAAGSRRILAAWQWSVISVLLLAAVAIDFSALHFLLIFLLAPASAALTATLGPALDGPAPVRRLASAAALLACVAWAAVIGLTGRLTPEAFGAGVRPGIFPETAAGRLSSLPLRAGIFHRPRDAEFLTWRLWPNWKVTIDNRPGFYNRHARKIYDEIWQGGINWEKYFSSWNVRVVVGDSCISQKHPEHNLYQELAKNPKWRPIYWDAQSIVYLDSSIDISASNFENFRVLKPGLSWAETAENISTPDQWLALKADLRRVILDDPTNAEAVEFLKQAEAATAGQ